MLRSLGYALFLAPAFVLQAAAQTPAPLAGQGCLGCHGSAGQGQGPVAALAGRDRGEIIAAMRAFAANERPATIMNRIARGYTDAEIEAIAAWFAAQPR